MRKYPNIDICYILPTLNFHIPIKIDITLEDSPDTKKWKVLTGGTRLGSYWLAVWRKPIRVETERARVHRIERETEAFTSLCNHAIDYFSRDGWTEERFKWVLNTLGERKDKDV